MKPAFSLAMGLRILRGKAGTARYLRGAVLGVALGLVPLIVVMEVSTGMIDGITERLIEMRSYHLQAVLPSTSTLEEERSEAELISGIQGVTDAVPERQGVVLLLKSGKSAGVTLRLVPPDFFLHDPGFRTYAALQGGTADLSAPGSVLIGAALARQLGVSAGQTLALVSPYTETGTGMPAVKVKRVAGVFDIGYQELEKAFIYASIDSSWDDISPRVASAMVGIKVADPFADLTRVKAEIGGLGRRVYTWRELERGKLSSFGIMKALLIFIMALIVLVSAVNVSSSVIMIAFERRLEIGILKSIGATPAGVAMSFMLAGFVTGVLGTALGAALGLLAAVNINGIMGALQAVLNAAFGLFSAARSALVPSAPAADPVTIFNSEYYLAVIPIRIRWYEVVLAAAGTIALSGIAAYLPARKAASARPLEIIRKV